MKYLSDQGTGCTIGVRFPVEVRTFSLLRSGQTDSGAQSASYPVGTERRLGREADNSTPFSAEVNGSCNYTSTLPYALMAYCLILLWQDYTLLVIG
jgi:hypothetical protein